MKFTELDAEMRKYETAHDHCVLSNISIVARLDGRSFTKLTRNNFNHPFDSRFKELMVQTTIHLMKESGFKIVYAYTQSDEISLLLSLEDFSFNRKERKINSVLAGEASGIFSLLLGSCVAFDCRVSQLPTFEKVIDYFRWRQEDATRNALNSYCYWTLRDEGLSARAATSKLSGLNVSDKNELLHLHGINFNNIPDWQKRGIGFFWQEVEKAAGNPLEKSDIPIMRRELKTDHNLPMRDAYGLFIREKLYDQIIAKGEEITAKKALKQIHNWLVTYPIVGDKIVEFVPDMLEIASNGLGIKNDTTRDD